MDLIKDETDVGQVVRVTYDEGVEFLNYNDVSVNSILRTSFLNSLKRKISLDTLEDSGYDELRLFSTKLVYVLKTTIFFSQSLGNSFEPRFNFKVDKRRKVLT